jgi:hypothetical protein
VTKPEVPLKAFQTASLTSAVPMRINKFKTTDAKVNKNLKAIVRGTKVEREVQTENESHGRSDFLLKNFTEEQQGFIVEELYPSLQQSIMHVSDRLLMVIVDEQAHAE